MIDTIRISVDITIDDFTLNCSRTLDGSAWRNKAAAMLQAEFSEILVELLVPAVAAYDARRVSIRRIEP